MRWKCPSVCDFVLSFTPTFDNRLRNRGYIIICSIFCYTNAEKFGDSMKVFVASRWFCFLESVPRMLNIVLIHISFHQFYRLWYRKQLYLWLISTWTSSKASVLSLLLGTDLFPRDSFRWTGPLLSCLHSLPHLLYWFPLVLYLSGGHLMSYRGYRKTSGPTLKLFQ